MVLKQLTAGMILLVSIVFIFSLPAFAAMTTYYIEELDMHIDFPDDGYVYDQDIDENHPVLTEFEFTAEEVHDYLAENDIYLEYSYFDPHYEINVMEVKPTSAETQKNYNTATDAELDIIANYIMDTPDFNFTGYTLYSKDDLTYIIFDYSFPIEGETTYTQSYLTVYDNKTIYISLFSFDEPVSLNMTAKLRVIADSMVFNQTTPLVQESDAEYSEENDLEPISTPAQDGDIQNNNDSNSLAVIGTAILWIVLGIAVIIIVLLIIVIKKQNKTKKIKIASKSSVATAAQTKEASPQTDVAPSTIEEELPTQELISPSVAPPAYQPESLVSTHQEEISPKENQITKLEQTLQEWQSEYEQIKSHIDKISLTDIESAYSEGKISAEQAQKASSRYSSLTKKMQFDAEAIADMENKIKELRRD